jgi:Rrf2 family protein
MRGTDLARRVAIPAPYASKIFRQLVVAGLLSAKKGHGGGFRLARRPQAIRFRDVLAAVGLTAESERCAFGWEACDPAHPCPLHPAWVGLKDALGTWAAGTTLADVATTSADDGARRRRPVSRRRKPQTKRNRAVK